MIKGTFPIERFKDIDTPFYYYDTKVLRETLDTIREELRHNPEYEVHYAIKANANPKVLRIISAAGFGADCVSGGEVRAAIEAGFPASKVVYAGVGKTDKEINYSLDHDIFCFNVESVPELEVINELACAKGKVAQVAFRINPNVGAHTHANITTGLAENKFGINLEQIEGVIEQAIALPHIDFEGVHFHIGSQIRELHVFENMCNKANAIVEKLESFGFSFRMVDVGGGLGINYDVPENEPIPNFASLFSIVHEYLNVEGKEVHFEFGRSLVGECGELITSVLYNKTTATGRRLLIIDASMTELIRPMLYGSYHNIENITSQEESFKKYTVVGTACESTDVFDENISLRKSKRGDLLAIKSAGAYGRSMASEYNMHELPKAVYSDQLGK